ncbi:MAG: FAD-dependent oxidoreductase [Proteobacteria bacterium]|nr:FAD-dependent oxidoreductase [Pseudomonadota bacterium]
MSESARNPEVIIIGGGIQGCSTAVHLGLKGVRALLIEKNYPGRHASGVNAGGVSRIGRFPSELPLSALSLEIWHDMESLVDDDCGFISNGRMKIAENEAEMEKLRERFNTVRALGHEHEQLIDQYELRQLEPDVAEHCVGGIYAPDCGHANPFRTTTAFARKARNLGQTIMEGVRVEKVSRAAGVWTVRTDAGEFQAPVLVNTAGAWGDRISDQMGEEVPMETIAPMLMVTARMPPIIRGVMGATDRILSIKQVPNGTIIIGGGYRGTADRDAETTVLDYKKLAYNAKIATEMFPKLKGARIVRSWAGIEGRMADAMPVISPSKTEEACFHAFGFSAHGFNLGPAVGSVLSELITAGQSNIPIDAFSIDRFAKA